MARIKNSLYIDTILFKRMFSETSSKIQVLKTDFPPTKQVRDHTQPKFWTLFHSTPPSVDQSSSNIFLFPGSGAQFVGMGKDLISMPKVQLLFEAASQYLNYNLLKVCLQGPVEKLNKLIHSHPAIYVTSLAALEKIKQEQPELIENCIATAGQSLGEIASLVFAGALSFEAGLHFVRVRAEYLQRACSNTKGGVVIVCINRESRLTDAIFAAKQFCADKLGIEQPVCEPSAYLHTECRLVGGHVEALEFIDTFKDKFRLSSVERVSVAGAFHTGLMRDASHACNNALKRIGDISEPRIHTLSNASGTVHTTTAELRRLLSVQVHKPVLWEQILHRLYMRPPGLEHPSTIAIGPGRGLGESLSKVNATAFRKYKLVEV